MKKIPSIPAIGIIAILAVLVGTVIILAGLLRKGEPVHFYSFEEPKPQQVGSIEGSLGYPSELIPSEMEVCAKNIETKKLYCTGTHIEDSKYTYGKGYKIRVPIGDYYVYAKLPGQEDYEAYYSEFVTCGLKADCLSHDPVKVTVKAGEITENVDPYDWYK
ncbi:hypothetical protein AMJ47_01340 [Parcubacteria bacterium DG_72]|nr:MAG: hypothetical protein AMJ47_01340 [Parcubacteria bacterium DG_72]